MTTEVAYWYEYVHNKINFLSIKVVNFDFETKTLNFYQDTIFQIIDPLFFDKKALLICEKIQTSCQRLLSPTKGRYLYFMCNLKNGVFDYDYSNEKSGNTTKIIANKLGQNLDNIEKNISDNILSGSFIRNFNPSDSEKVPGLIKPCKYHTIVNNDNTKDNRPAIVTLRECLKINELFRYKGM